MVPMIPWARRAVALVCLTTLLAGCASWVALSSQVSTFGTWPEGRAPGTFAFDRLPSQAERGQAHARLEAAAAAALEQAGFTAAAPGLAADVKVEVHAQLLHADLPPWPHQGWAGLGWGLGPAGPGSGWSVGLGLQGGVSRYEREVAVLIRDPGSGQVLYEARAHSEGATPGDAAILAAMFRAAMSGFPATSAAPKRVTIPLQR